MVACGSTSHPCKLQTTYGPPGKAGTLATIHLGFIKETVCKDLDPPKLFRELDTASKESFIFIDISGKLHLYIYIYI